MSVYSITKSLWHTEKIKALQEKKTISPTMIQVDLEAYCNDNCSFCSYRKEDGYNTAMLKLIDGKPNTENKPIGKPSADSRIPEIFAEELPRQMVEADIKAIEITGGGEPTLWPAFDNLVRALGSAEREIGLVTNGSNLSGERIELISKFCLWVRFSMDSAIPETHRKIHRTANEDFDRRLQNLTKLGLIKNPNLVLGISFIVTPENFNEISEAARVYSEIKGVNHIRFSWMYDKEGHAGLSQSRIEDVKIKLRQAKRLFEREDFKVIYEEGRIDLYSKPNDDFDTCFMQRFVWAIGADCLVYPCCIMKYHPNFAFGDIRNQTLKQMIDTSKKFMDDLDPKNCFPCWLRNRNISIGNAVEKPLHHNFI